MSEWFTNTDPSLRRAWHPVARSTEVPDGTVHGVELLGERWCLARIDGRPLAFVDECPHRLAPLSAGRVAAGTLMCGYHGYRFAPDGLCVEIPAIAPGSPIPSRARLVPAAAVCDHLGLVWLAPDEPLTPLPDVPEYDDPAFVACPLPAAEWEAGAAQMIDNFLDLGHFPFLHLATFAAPEDRVVPDYRVERDGWRFVMTYRHLTKALADSHDPAAGYRVVERLDRFEFTAPHHLRLRIDYASEGAVLTITFFHQPLDERRTRLWCTDYRNDIPDTPEAKAATIAFQQAVGAEDKAMLERFHRKAVALDPGREVHTRADRITVELRRVLKDLVAAASS